MKLMPYCKRWEAKSKVLGGLFDIQGLKENIASNEGKMLAEDFWNDNKQAEAILKETKTLKEKLETLEALTKQYEDVEVLAELTVEEPEDQELSHELERELLELKEAMSVYETQMLLSGEYDDLDAFMEIHPGAGGTESQDWASMLLRMYERFCNRHSFRVEYIDYQAGDEAGLKSVAMKIIGAKAYGLLKAEHGIHRLVRLSPFDTNNRRHTSFASVEVIPVIDQKTEIEINEDDLNIDVYRASGAGGQHVNKTNSAVRITHLPTGIVVTSQNERSQLLNRETALQVLRAKLALLLQEANAKQIEEIRGEKTENAWGSQIRSYVFHPYSLIKDHRTNHEVGDVNRVMDGDLDDFIDAYLKANIEEL